MKTSLSQLALSNLMRNVFRSLAIVVSVTVVAGTLFYVTTQIKSVENTLVQGATRLGSDLMILPKGFKKIAKQGFQTGKPLSFYLDKIALDKVWEVKAPSQKTKKMTKAVSAASPLLLVASQPEYSFDNQKIQLIGFNPQTDFTIQPWLHKIMPREISANDLFIGSSFPHKVGETIILFDKKFTIAGKLDTTGTEFFDNSCFMSISTLQEQHDVESEQLSIILIKIAENIQPRLAARFLERNVPGVKAVLTEEVKTSVSKQLFSLLKSIMIASLILWGIAALMIGVLFSMIINERCREIGLLRSMGASQLMVFRLVAIEASVLSSIGCFLGILFGATSLYMFNNIIMDNLSFPFQWPTLGQFAILSIVCLGLSFFTGVGAALIPAIRICRMEPHRAICRGD